MIPFPKEGFLGVVLGMHTKRFENGARANLRHADLWGANLEDANLRYIVGQGSKQMVCVQTPYWAVVMTPDQMAIGCEQHAITDWWTFDEDRIGYMDGEAIEFWRIWKPVLQQIHAASFGDQGQ
jgi:hypothetical protein